MTHQLHGREAEIGCVTRLLQSVAAGTSAALYVEGGWGSGRTRLLREAADRAGRLEFSILDDICTGADPGALVEARAARGPVLVVLDDLHQEDPALVHHLHMLPWRLRDRSIAWVLSRRRNAGGPPADRIFARPYPAGDLIDLRPLSAQAISSLVADRTSGAVTAPASLLQTTGGNPLLAVELARSLHGREMDGVLDCPPARVRACVRRFLTELSAACRGLLQVGAVLGVRFVLRDVTTMLGRPAAELLAPIEEALAADVLTCIGDQLVFRQELFRRCVLASMPQPARAALEHEATVAFEARGGAPVARSRAVVRRNNPIVLRPVDGTPAPEEPSTIPPCAARMEVPERSVMRAILQGRAREARTMARRLMSDVGLSDDARATTTAAALMALSLLDGEDAAREAREVLRDGGQIAAAPTATAVLADQAWADCRLDEGLRLARDAVRRSHGAAPGTWQTYPHLALARKLVDLRDFKQARTVLLGVPQDPRTPARPDDEVCPVIVAARLHLYEGRLSAARHEAERVRQFARRADARLLLPQALSILAVIELRAGDLPAAAGNVRICRSLLDSSVVAPRSALYAWAEILLAADQDGSEAARTLLDRRFPGLDIRMLFAEEAAAAAWLVRLALAVGDRPAAEIISAQVQRLATENPGVAVATAGAEHARALLARDTAALARIAEGHPDPWARAWAAEDLGGLLADAAPGGDRACTADPLEHLLLAVTAFDRVGAHRDAVRVDERLQALTSRSGTRIRRADGWGELSETERTVAYLAGQGLTNQQIATRVSRSPHTVNYHLRRIFQKLGIRSRVELARLTLLHYSGGRASAESTADAAG